MSESMTVEQAIEIAHKSAVCDPCNGPIGWDEAIVVLADEVERLQARVAELEAICDNVPEGRTPADARVLREANHALADEVAQAKWHKDIAEAALLSVEKERDAYKAANGLLVDQHNMDRKERDELRRRVAELEALVHAAKCPQCDGSGAYYDGIGNVCQCQWCYETEKARETAASKIKAEAVREFAEQTGDHYVINMAIDYNKANQIEGGA